MSNIYSLEELKYLGSVGENVQIDRSVIFIAPQNIHVANNVRIDAFCILSGTKGITIGSQVHIASYCQLVASGDTIIMEDFSGLSSRVSIFTASDDYVHGSLTNPTVPDQFKCLKVGPVILEKHVIVGCGSVIMPKCVLGFGSSVGALTFVAKSIAPGMVMSGQPAKVVSNRDIDKLKEMENMYQQYMSQLKNINMIPTFTYIDFAKSDKPQEWFGEQPPPFPSESKIGDMFMWKDLRGKYSVAWMAKYYTFNGTQWLEHE